MKLYTEEQVRQAMIDARISPWLRTDFLLKDYTPIKLPSDEEMVKILDPHSDEFAHGYYAAINMIEEQIKQQDNGHT